MNDAGQAEEVARAMVADPGATVDLLIKYASLLTLDNLGDIIDRMMPINLTVAERDGLRELGSILTTAAEGW